LPLYMAIESHSIGPVAIFLILGVTGGIVNGTYPFIAADLFPTAVRFSGIALAFNLATAIFTGLTPFAFTNIIHVSGSLITSSAYPIGLAVVSLIVGFWIKGSSTPGTSIDSRAYVPLTTVRSNSDVYCIPVGLRILIRAAGRCF
jgi:hypothetical protein